ncbi:MAG: hypothetical protein ABI083_17000, partial [Lapillicoccus sp.]
MTNTRVIQTIQAILGTAAVTAGVMIAPSPAHSATVASPLPRAAAAAVVVLHVSPDGDDSNTGEVTSPLRTPQVAVDRLGTTGGVVELGDGTYRRQRIVLVDRQRVTVRAAAGASPV